MGLCYYWPSHAPPTPGLFTRPKPFLKVEERILATTSPPEARCLQATVFLAGADLQMNQPRRYNVERSCLRCHERKVRCDKRSPCSKCVRLNVPCQYPGPERVKRRAPKTADTDVVTRLEQLERAITSLAEGPSPAQSVTKNVASNSQSSRETSAASSSRNTRAAAAESSSAQHGFLVGNGAYMDEPFLSRVVEKEKELQSAIGSPRTGSGIPGKQPRLKADGILLNPLITHNDVKTLLPSRWQATTLWDTYLQRIDPVLKLLHIPTYKARIFAAISRPDSAPADVHCLLFAIFYSATTALCSDNPGNETAKEDLSRYQVGLQLSIFQASFLDAPTLFSIQAMATYLVSAIPRIQPDSCFFINWRNKRCACAVIIVVELDSTFVGWL